MQLQLGIQFRGCSHSFMFRLPRSLDLQVAPTAEDQCLQGSQAVYTTHTPVGYLPRDVASLRIRHEQLIRLDFHQLDCSLVGRSNLLSAYKITVSRPRTNFERASTIPNMVLVVFP
jgi:hypothetical protein